MAKSIAEILGYETLTRAVQDPRNGLPTANLPAGFFNLTVPVAGQVSSYMKTPTTRETAKLTGYESPSREGNPVGMTKVPVTLIHAKEHRNYGAILLTQINNMEDTRAQRMAEQEIGRQTLELRRKFSNLRRNAVYSMLGLGHIYFNSNGDLLHSSSGNAVDVSYSPVTGNANIGTWNTTSADIAGKLWAIKQAYNQDHGLNITDVIYGKNIVNYLALNDSFKSLINGNQGFAASFGANKVPNGFQDLTWWSGHDIWMEDKDGTNRLLIGNNQVTFLAQPSPEWYEMQEGSYIVPTDIGNVAGDAQAALSNFNEVNGMFSYATITNDPPGIKQVVGDTFLPVAKVPGSLRICTDVTAAAS